MSAAPVLRYVRAEDRAIPLRKANPGEPIETLAFYRKHTEALLRQYVQRSMEAGRAPSILGNFVFRGRASSEKRRTFEELLIFAMDIEKCLKHLDKSSQELVARIAMQEYSYGETALLTGQSVRTVIRRYNDAIDTLSGILLDRELLELDSDKCCQGGKKQ